MSPAVESTAASGVSRHVVVGAGLSGAATAWALAREGHEVTVVERRRPATPDGSSHGSARIVRFAYPDPWYARLAVRAHAHWDRLQATTGRQLITPTGALDFGARRDPVALAGVLVEAGVDHELIGRSDAARRWPQISFDSDVLWHPGAGVLDAESAVHVMLRLARAAGARVLTDWPVESVTRTGSGFRVHATSGDHLDAAGVVVAAGGWLPAFLGRLPLPGSWVAGLPSLTVRQEQAFHFPYRQLPDGDAVAPEVMPTFIHKAPEIATYGLPGGRDADFRGQKIAEFNGGRVLTSARDQDGVVDDGNRRRVTGYVARHLPGLVPEPYAETTCLFTSTPTEDFVVDVHEGLTVVSPCSGHGAKFAPLIGELAAEVATGRTRSPDRFRVRGAVGV